jgi:hypothetical protein
MPKVKNNDMPFSLLWDRCQHQLMLVNGDASKLSQFGISDHINLHIKRTIFGIYFDKE